MRSRLYLARLLLRALGLGAAAVDVRTLVQARPTGMRPQQIVSGYVSYNQPPPGSFYQKLYVVIPGRSTERVWEFASWPVLHGGTLPQQGDVVVLAYHEQRKPVVIYWEGTYSDPNAVNAQQSQYAIELGGTAPPPSSAPASFTLEVSPSSTTVTRGGTSVPLTVSIDGLTEIQQVNTTVQFSVDDTTLPDDVTAQFENWTIRAADADRTGLLLSVGVNAPVGTYGVLVDATSAEWQQTAQVQLTIQ